MTKTRLVIVRMSEIRHTKYFLEVPSDWNDTCIIDEFVDRCVPEVHRPFYDQSQLGYDVVRSGDANGCPITTPIKLER